MSKDLNGFAVWNQRRWFLNNAFLVVSLVGHCICETPMINIFIFFSLSPAEIDRINKGETKKESEKEIYQDLFANKNLKLKERVLIPTKQYPRVSVRFLSYFWLVY